MREAVRDIPTDGMIAFDRAIFTGATPTTNTITLTKLRLLTRIAYGFKSTDNLIAMCLLDRGGHCPPLPGRK